jgi:hypothetical protein
MQWTEMVTVQDVLDRNVCVEFRSFSGEHTTVCVPPDAMDRTRTLTGARVAVKELGRVFSTKPTDIEKGNVVLSGEAHSAGTADLTMQMIQGLPLDKIRETLNKSRSVGRDDGDFDAIHTMLTNDARAADAGDALDTFNIVEYHPATSSTCSDVSNPASWFWIIIKVSVQQVYSIAQLMQLMLLSSFHMRIATWRRMPNMVFPTTARRNLFWTTVSSSWCSAPRSQVCGYLTD